MVFRKWLSIITFVLLACNLSAQHVHSNASAVAEGNVFLQMMDTMMVKMAAVPVTKSATQTFFASMIPHHQAALTMATYEIGHGKNFAMRQLAKSILAEQQVEIEEMKIWLQKEDLSNLSTPAFEKNLVNSMEVMMQSLPAGKLSGQVDEAFARIMVPHHQAAIDMARALIQNGTSAVAGSFASSLIAAQSIEIEQMLFYLSHLP
ncbi:MAG TPA: DUF305 domain-containing protein [Chitinophagaceae bacterium]|nr:DUF305 domain-containing protein [Chitinophagaceae bacterium]